MKSSDIVLSILIFILFGMLFTATKTTTKIKKIEKNWATYRCNPLVMPFVSLFGHDSTQNFMTCIQALQTKYMYDILEPVNYNITVLTVIGSQLAESVNSMRAFMNNLRNFISDIVKNIYNVILNLLIEIQRSLIWIKSVVSKMTGILTAISYNMKGGITTGESIGKGPPGILVKSLSKK